MWNIIQNDKSELWPGKGIHYVCNLDFGGMNLVQGHDTILGQSQ